MISEMEELLEELEPIYQQFFTSAQEANRKIFEAQALRDLEKDRLAREAEAKRLAEIEEENRKAREAEEKRAAEISEQQRRALKEELLRQEKIAEQQRQIQQLELQRRRQSQLQSSINKVSKSLSTAWGAVRIIKSGDYWNSSQTISLKAENNRDLTNWTINNTAVQLVRGKRYLIIIEDNGRIGWARVMQTRMSFIGRGVNWSEGLFVNGTRLPVSIKGDWSASPPYGRNLFIEVKDRLGFPACIVSAWFSLQDLEILKIEPPNNTNPLPKEQTLLLEILSNNIASFKAAALNRIVCPFVYQSNLYGNDAEDFFGAIGSYYELKVAKINENPFIISKKSNLIEVFGGRVSNARSMARPNQFVRPAPPPAGGSTQTTRTSPALRKTLPT